MDLRAAPGLVAAAAAGPAEMLGFHQHQMLLPQQEEIHFGIRSGSIQPIQGLVQARKSPALHVEAPEVGRQGVSLLPLHSAAPQRPQLQHLC